MTARSLPAFIMKHCVLLAVGLVTSFAQAVYGQSQPPRELAPKYPPQGQAPDYGPPPGVGPAQGTERRSPDVHERTRPNTSDPGKLVLPQSPVEAPPAPASAANPLPPGEAPRLGRATELDRRLDAMLATSGGLTAERAAERAYAMSFDAKAFKADAKSARARLDRTLIAYFPRLSVLGRYTRLSSISPPPGQSGLLVDPSIPNGPLPPGTQIFKSSSPPFPVFNDQYLVQANLTVPLSDYALRLPYDRAAAAHFERAARLEESASRLRAAAEARVLHYAWLRARAHEVVAGLAVEQAERHAAEVQVAVDAGHSTKAELLDVNAQIAEHRLLLEQAANLTVRLLQQLTLAMHDPLGTRYEPGEDLRRDLAPFPEGADVERLVAAALRRRVELRALDERVSAYREDAKRARAKYFPRAEAFGDLLYASPNPRYFPQTSDFKLTWDAGAQVSWTFNETLEAPSDASEAEGRVERAEAERSAFRDSLRNEVYEAWHGESEAKSQAEVASFNLETAEEAYRVRHMQFTNGGATSVELTQSELDLFRSRMEAINAWADMHAARARLVHATGRDAPTANR